jgi:hypothetical protein
MDRLQQEPAVVRSAITPCPPATVGLQVATRRAYMLQHAGHVPNDGRPELLLRALRYFRLRQLAKPSSPFFLAAC